MDNRMWWQVPPKRPQCSVYDWSFTFLTSCLSIPSCRTEMGRPWPEVRYDLLVFVNKAQLEHSCSCSFLCCLWPPE